MMPQTTDVNERGGARRKIGAGNASALVVRRAVVRATDVFALLLLLLANAASFPKGRRTYHVAKPARKPGAAQDNDKTATGLSPQPGFG